MVVLKWSKSWFTSNSFWVENLEKRLSMFFFFQNKISCIMRTHWISKSIKVWKDVKEQHICILIFSLEYGPKWRIWSEIDILNRGGGYNFFLENPICSALSSTKDFWWTIVKFTKSYIKNGYEKNVTQRGNILINFSVTSILCIGKLRTCVSRCQLQNFWISSQYFIYFFKIFDTISFYIGKLAGMSKGNLLLTTLPSGFLVNFSFK